MVTKSGACVLYLFTLVLDSAFIYLFPTLPPWERFRGQVMQLHLSTWYDNNYLSGDPTICVRDLIYLLSL
eukprot:CCRYP_013411-RA/>CCRYP_013411-RA protein AED:0.40 eAED:0.40 QI:42/1/0.5/1/0/0/2/0/69